MLLSSPDPAWFHTGSTLGEGPGIDIRYLGTAGFVFESAQHTLVLDPYITRPGVFASLFRPLVPDEEALKKHIPHADAVLVGHAHHDHVLDAPILCQQTGATFIGSPSACNVARSAGLAETQITCTKGRETLDLGPSTARGIPSRHGRVYFGRVALPGKIPTPPPWPPRIFDLRHGLVLNWWINMAGLKIVHVDSADFINDELEGLEADIVCLCAIGRKYRPGYTQDIVRILKPRWVIPCHWDWMLEPFEQPRHHTLPGVDLGGFLAEIRAAGAEPVLLPIGGKLHVPAPSISV